MSDVPFIQTEAEFDSLLKLNSTLVIDFTAQWCGPCRIVAPLMNKLLEQYGDRVKVFKLDLDTNRSVAVRFGVKSIPAVMFFKNGELMEVSVGVKTYEEFCSILEPYLD
ncbi:MAG: thioredoxin [Synechocystis sp.]|nr:thioredoxin [Synechocystis sp.]